ncbi:HAD family hydrolase [Methylobacterium durans]|uniref:Haloacid dehalogenase n=1 Tax=Methylobacterium durans TaxID=2202825 RepID=A0A2U8W880_9HYPH|nr:HAD family hydrolase [Methylobacterium durans]AWN42323.1 haloacid dehalogenase [Methylobacterium durans]
MKTPIASGHLNRRTALAALAGLPALAGCLSASAEAPTSPVAAPLASWNESASKQAITDFLGRVTREGGSDYVEPAERIAVFDNDGTLWTEHPMYVQLAFVLDRVKALAPMHPEWKNKQPFQAVLDGDMTALAASGERGMMELVMVTHAGMTSAEFAAIVSQWLATARHPRFKRPYIELVYQPMIELLGYLRANGFKTFIVSGGGVEFMRPWTNRVYGVPPEQVVGSSIKTRFEMRDGRPELLRLAQMNFIDDKAGKPVGINEYIGRRPIAAFGNSDGDLEMLQWTTMSAGARLGLIVHHTDAEREYAYDRNTIFGRLDKALDAAVANNWAIMDMKRDWKVIFPFELG